MDPEAKFFGPRGLWLKIRLIKKINFLTQPHNMGVYGFAWIPAIIYKVVCIRGQILGPRALCQVLAFHLYSFDLNCGATSHLPITWATTKLVTIMSS